MPRRIPGEKLTSQHHSLEWGVLFAKKKDYFCKNWSFLEELKEKKTNPVLVLGSNSSFHLKKSLFCSCNLLKRLDWTSKIEFSTLVQYNWGNTKRH